MQTRVPMVLVLAGLVVGAVGGWISREIWAGAGKGSGMGASSTAKLERLSGGAERANRDAADTAPQPVSAEGPQKLSQAANAARMSAASGEGASLGARVARRGTALPPEEDSPEPAAADHSPTLDDLIDSTDVRCAFGAGNGGSWPKGKLTVGDAAWQGGPVDFQSIDYGAGTAQMLGSVARSPTGQVPVKVVASDNDVTFTGVAANGTLNTISIFRKFDSAGHHTAVISMHDGKYELDIAQFYGGCDSTSEGLKAGSR